MMQVLFLVAIVAAVLAIVGGLVWLLTRQSRKLGEAQNVSKGLRKSVDHAKEGLEIDEEVDAMSDDAVLDELRDSRRK